MIRQEIDDVAWFCFFAANPCISIYAYILYMKYKESKYQHISRNIYYIGIHTIIYVCFQGKFAALARIWSMPSWSVERKVSSVLPWDAPVLSWWTISTCQSRTFHYITPGCWKGGWCRKLSRVISLYWFDPYWMYKYQYRLLTFSQSSRTLLQTLFLRSHHI